MLRGVPRDAFEIARRVEETFDLAVRLHGGAEFGRLGDRVFELDTEDFWNQLRDAIDVAKRHPEYPPDIANCSLGLERSEGHDLRDLHLVVATLERIPLRHGTVVFLRHITNHLLTPTHAEIHIDVGHRNPFGIQEPFEDDVVFDRVDIRDVHAVGDQTSG